MTREKTVTTNNLEYGVEYRPNEDEGEQWEELTEWEFLDLIASHKRRGFSVNMEYDSFSIRENGRFGKRLTIVDDWGIYYG